MLAIVLCLVLSMPCQHSFSLHTFYIVNFISEPCAGVKCKEPKKCTVNSQGNAQCECPDERDCPMTVNTVCGSDGKTYLNECVMKAKACLEGMSVYVLMDGYCGE